MLTQPGGRRRTLERLRLRQPIDATFAAAPVQIIDISLSGCRIEHTARFASGSEGTLAFAWEGETASIPCRVTRCRLDPLSSLGTRARYQSGLSFIDGAHTPAPVRHLIETQLAEILSLQRQNARGESDAPASAGERLARRSEPRDSDGRYLRVSLDKNGWRRTVTDDPQPPPDGFTIQVSVEPAELDLLCRAYEKGNREVRTLIRMSASLTLGDRTARNLSRG
jgi:hypothetical protein